MNLILNFFFLGTDTPDWCLIQNVVQATYFSKAGHFRIKCEKSLIKMQSWFEKPSKEFFPKG